MSIPLMADNPLKRRFTAKILLRRAKRAHDQGDYTQAEAYYLNAIHDGDDAIRKTATEGMIRLRDDARPTAIVYPTSPGHFLEEPIPDEARSENVYAYARARAADLGQLVIIETPATALYISPRGQDFWGPRIPGAVRTLLAREDPREESPDALFI